MRNFNRGKEEHRAKKEGLYSEGIVIVRDLIVRDHCINFNRMPLARTFFYASQAEFGLVNVAILCNFVFLGPF